MLNNSKTAVSTGFYKISKRFFPVNEKAIKNRIKSVSSIAKITKAMKMVNKNFLKIKI
jgi:hypothetical protein